MEDQVFYTFKQTSDIDGFVEGSERIEINLPMQPHLESFLTTFCSDVFNFLETIELPPQIFRQISVKDRRINLREHKDVVLDQTDDDFWSFLANLDFEVRFLSMQEYKSQVPNKLALSLSKSVKNHEQAIELFIEEKIKTLPGAFNYKPGQYKVESILSTDNTQNLVYGILRVNFKLKVGNYN